jgi:hypothetical protein
MSEKLGLLVLAVLLWAVFSASLPQMIPFYQSYHQLAISVYLGTEQAVIAYYKQLIWGGTLIELRRPLFVMANTA